ncbi:2-hydroxychromene-2-carboxylate isomerase [Pseudooceanicola sediminis]|uniref:2-hydroxychromene-2-carboxylate isomerase n=1 Tax=Pseudooceanicola sediminis TaxID=2211117 RepID=A0A399J2C9_9RHOB|nr:2-hydroxychromene-2-carboxylate isomerase [Pseudooceanicola sediminis]KAA2313985.1 2-hydroxychromene-2-carboxylate isomerase [Puniceibacterium sp. HSS470]RII38797.1 2-hydroxychromene-2-carboxylate isomerase [Pseudooceanicola sediminis]|tara:strand:- start:120625 stop:121227 length:603 start_codon:yes stop_codon:yes gene_type:complete
MTKHIDYYFTTISPFTYLAGDRLEQVAARHGATISYKPVDLTTIFNRTGGLALSERPIARQEYRLQELRRAMVKSGLQLTLHPAFFPTNPAPSCYAIIAAQAAGGGDVGLLSRLFLAACWREDRNVADDEVIRDCLSRAGFDPELANSGLLSGAETFARNTEEALNAGVFGAPFYVVDGTERFWGHDRLSDLEAFLDGKL